MQNLTVSLLLLLSILVSTINEVEALVSIVLSAKGFGSILAKKISSTRTQRTKKRQEFIKQSEFTFNPEAYRREMTDFVYQKSIERSFAL